MINAQCEKLNRKRSSFVASFVSTHGRTIDDVDRSILEARSSLMEVKQDLQERMTRWRHIESLCGFPITTNPGFNYLETLLRSGSNLSRYVCNPRQTMSFDAADDADETGSVISSTAGTTGTTCDTVKKNDTFDNISTELVTY